MVERNHGAMEYWIRIQSTSVEVLSEIAAALMQVVEGPNTAVEAQTVAEEGGHTA